MDISILVNTNATRHWPGEVSDGKRPPLETRVLFRGIHGRLELDLSGKDKNQAGAVLPTFYSLAGEQITTPKRFHEAIRAVTKAVNCIDCSHCHFSKRSKREETRAGNYMPTNQNSERDLLAAEVAVKGVEGTCMED